MLPPFHPTTRALPLFCPASCSTSLNLFILFPLPSLILIPPLQFENSSLPHNSILSPPPIPSPSANFTHHCLFSFPLSSPNFTITLSTCPDPPPCSPTFSTALISFSLLFLASLSPLPSLLYHAPLTSSPSPSHLLPIPLTFLHPPYFIPFPVLSSYLIYTGFCNLFSLSTLYSPHSLYLSFPPSLSSLHCSFPRHHLPPVLSESEA